MINKNTRVLSFADKAFFHFIRRTDKGGTENMILKRREIILEALNDYKKWFDSNDYSDKEKRKAIDEAIKEIEKEF